MFTLSLLNRRVGLKTNPHKKSCKSILTGVEGFRKFQKFLEDLKVRQHNFMYSRTFQNPLEHLRTFQNLLEHFKTFKKNIENVMNLNEHSRTFQNIRISRIFYHINGYFQAIITYFINTISFLIKEHNVLLVPIKALSTYFCCL